MTKRNENRKSTVKGIIANPQTQIFEAFEIEIPYTRSTQKAAEFAREILNIEEYIMLSVTEIQNEALKPIVYDNQLVCDYMTADFETKEEAEQNANEMQSVIPYTMFIYSGQVWLTDGEKYSTEHFTDWSALKFGKIDTRGFVKMMAESFYNAKVIGINDDKRTEQKRFAIVDNDKLQLCVKNS